MNESTGPALPIEQPAEQHEANGHPMTGPMSPEDVAYVNYGLFAQQLGAILTLLSSMPLESLLRACKRHQRTSVLTLPANVSQEQIAMQALALRNDEKLITAALHLQRVHAAVVSGRPA